MDEQLTDVGIINVAKSERFISSQSKLNYLKTEFLTCSESTF